MLETITLIFERGFKEDPVHDFDYFEDDLFQVTNDTVYNSTIHVYLDMTNQQVGFTLQMRLAEAFQAFASSVLASCHIPDSVTSLPIQVECE